MRKLIAMIFFDTGRNSVQRNDIDFTVELSLGDVVEIFRLWVGWDGILMVSLLLIHASGKVLASR